MTRLSVEQELEQSRKQVEDLRHALDQSSIVAVTDSKGTITYVNDKFCEISKYSREDLIGQNHRIINSGYHGHAFFVELWRTISSGGVWRGEIRNRARDGSYYWVLTTIVPFMTADGRPFQYVAIRTDITEQKHAQEQLDHQRLALVHSEKMASLGELAAGIAHELGNPLAAISGRMEFLEMQIKSGKGSREDTLKTIDTVRRLTDRMTSIIRGMRSLSRDGSKDPFQSVSIGQIIRDVLNFTSESFQRHGIETRLGKIPDRLQVVCQETQISQIFVNLINNARDAVMDSDPRWISVEVLERPESVEIAVTDSGAGIPEEIRDKIMLPFFTTKATGKGSGLGLSISKAIVEHHGGFLRIDPESRNTRFVLSLPRTRPSR